MVRVPRTTKTREEKENNGSCGTPGRAFADSTRSALIKEGVRDENLLELFLPELLPEYLPEQKPGFQLELLPESG